MNLNKNSHAFLQSRLYYCSVSLSIRESRWFGWISECYEGAEQANSLRLRFWAALDKLAGKYVSVLSHYPSTTFLPYLFLMYQLIVFRCANTRFISSIFISLCLFTCFYFHSLSLLYIVWRMMYHSKRTKQLEPLIRPCVRHKTFISKCLKRIHQLKCSTVGKLSITTNKKATCGNLF